MTMTDVRPVIDLPGRLPHRHGLFSVIDFDLDERAAAGVTWESSGCDPIQVIQDACIVSGATADTLTGNVNCLVGKTDPFGVVAFDQSSLGRSPRDADATKAVARLQLMESSAVESFLSGVLDSGATDVTVASGDLRRQVAEIEFALAEKGGQGIILARRSTVSLLADDLVVNGALLRTKLGTPVAGFGGWDAADTDTVFGVTNLVGTRSSIVTGVGYDQLANSNGSYAQRDYSIGWDCTAVAATPA